MNDWPVKPLAEVCEINPRLPRHHDLVDDQYVSFVPMAAVDEVSGRIVEGQSRRFAEVKKGYTHFRDGDVLFAKITPCMENGKAAIANDLIGGVGFGSTEFHVLRPGPLVLADWLFYFVRQRSFRAHAKQNFTGTAGQQRVPTTFMSSAAIPVPPLPEQRRIVDLLSRAEGIVRLRREAEKKAAELIPTLFLDMFGDPATNPKGWDIKPLHTVAEVGSGNGFPNAYQGKTEGAYPFYKVSDMNTKGNEVEMIAANNYISEDDLVALRAKAFPSGTVIFPKIGAAIATNKKRVLTCPSCFDNNVMGITPGNGLTPAFLHALMFSKDISDFASDSNPPSMRKSTVEAWEIPVPPIGLQAEFGKQVESVRSIQSQQSAATAKSQATFDALLAQTFSGRG